MACWPITMPMSSTVFKVTYTNLTILTNLSTTLAQVCVSLNEDFPEEGLVPNDRGRAASRCGHLSPSSGVGQDCRQ